MLQLRRWTQQRKKRFPRAEADKKDPKSDKKSDEPKRKRNLGHLSGSFETNTIYYVEDSKTGAVVPHNSYGSNNFLKLDYQLG